ncbi:MAG: ABC transporter substrate-binding protein [Thermoanaerobaculales bacterium]|jgi:iron complex transport system substrate-binding protein|nr:ABC transporter substrate-binding protein [Thermoanaerobaculales bacterium]
MSRALQTAALVFAASLLAPPCHVAAGEPAVVVTDAAGRTVELDELPRRLLVIGDGTFMVAHLLAMFQEGRERMIGMERRGTAASSFLPLVDPNYETKTFLAPNPGPEQIAGIRPDLVICRGTLEDQTARALAEIGIPVVYLSMESPERFLGDLEILGKVLGRPDRGAAIADFYRARLDRISAALAGIVDADRPRVLVAMAIARGGRVAVQVPARPWMQTQITERAGASPVWLEDAAVTTGWTVVTIEQIARWSPDWIFVVFWHSMEPKRALADLAADRHWSALAAVQNGRLRAFPGDIYGWDSPDPRWILGLQWAAATLHPERFPGYDAEAELVRFYGELYGMEPADIEASIAPAIRMDLR